MYCIVPWDKVTASTIKENGVSVVVCFGCLQLKYCYSWTNELLVAFADGCCCIWGVVSWSKWKGSLISFENSGSWICFCFTVHICTTQISFYFLQHLYVQHRQGHVSLQEVYHVMDACMYNHLYNHFSIYLLNVLYLLYWHQDKGTGSINFFFSLTETNLLMSSLQIVHK